MAPPGALMLTPRAPSCLKAEQTYSKTCVKRLPPLKTKTCVKQPLKNRQIKTLMTNGSLTKDKSIADLARDLNYS